MQVNPALPWNSSVEGGVIQLREPLVLQQLLDGALDVVVKDGHDELVEGGFRIYPSDNKLYLGGNSLDYLVANVDTSSSSTQYSELILERALGADETLHSVSVHVPDVIVSPSLPWSDSIEGGVIILATPITYQQLLKGVLEITLHKNGQNIPADYAEDSLRFVIKDPDTSIVLYSIEEFSGESSELTLQQQNYEEGVAISEINLRETLLDGFYSANGGQYDKFVFQIEHNIAKPVYGMKNSETQASWYVYAVNHMNTSVLAYPAPSSIINFMTNVLNNFGGGVDKYQIDANGIQRSVSVGMIEYLQ